VVSTRRRGGELGAGVGALGGLLLTPTSKNGESKTKTNYDRKGIFSLTRLRELTWKCLFLRPRLIHRVMKCQNDSCVREQHFDVEQRQTAIFIF
jgi:hypothetical protein